MHVDDAGFLRNPMAVGDGGNRSDFFLRTFHKGQGQDAHKGAIAIGALSYAGLATGQCLVGSMTDIKNFSIGGKFIFPEPGKKTLSDVLDIDFPVIFLETFQCRQGHGSVVRPGPCRLMMTAIACEVRAKEAAPLLKFIGDTKGIPDGKAKNGVIELLVIKKGNFPHVLVLYFLIIYYSSLNNSHAYTYCLTK